MAKAAILVLVSLSASVLLVGCEPAPSTKLAPDVEVPDTSHLTPEQIKKMHEGSVKGPADRATKTGG